MKGWSSNDDRRLRALGDLHRYIVRFHAKHRDEHVRIRDQTTGRRDVAPRSQFGRVLLLNLDDIQRRGRERLDWSTHPCGFLGKLIALRVESKALSGA